MTFVTKIIVPEWLGLVWLSRLRAYAQNSWEDDLDAIAVGLLFLVVISVLYWLWRPREEIQRRQRVDD
jgi:hypothetical protein